MVLIREQSGREVRLRKLLLLAAPIILPSLAVGQTLRQSSVAGIMVPDGFDAAAVPTAVGVGRVSVESSGNLVVTGCEDCPARQFFVFRLSPQGQVLARSGPIRDPDGMAVDASGRVFVTDSPCGSLPCVGHIILVGSLDGGTDTIFAEVGGGSNPNGLGISSTGRMVLVEADGRLREVNAQGQVVEPRLAFLGPNGSAAAFDATGQLFAGTYAYSGQPGEGRLVRVDAGGSVVPLAAFDVGDIAPGLGGYFGQELFASDRWAGRVVTVDEATGVVSTFATGFVEPFGLAFDGTELLYVADRGRILRIFPLANIPTEGLVSWWRADGNANDSAGTNHGTPQNGATFAPGKVGQAFRLDGMDDFVEVPTFPEVSEAITVAAWIQYTSVLPDMDTQTIVAKADNNGTAAGWTLHLKEVVNNIGVARFIVYDDNGGISAVSTGPVDINTWHFVAASYDGVDQRIYLDGNLISSTENSGRINPASSVLLIGRSDDSHIHGPVFFAGFIDEVMVYDRALSSVEIEVLYVNALRPNVPPVPQGFMVALSEQGGVQLAWEDVVGETGYVIERKVGEGEWETLPVDIPADVTIYNDQRLPGCAEVCYRISSFNSSGTSAGSQHRCIKPAPDTFLASLNIQEDDIYAAVGEALVIHGVVLDTFACGVPNQVIAISDSLLALDVELLTGADGGFTYTTFAIRVGTYLIAVDLLGDVLQTYPILVAVGNDLPLVLSKSLSVHNDTDHPVTANLLYEGPWTPEDVTNGISIQRSGSLTIPPGDSTPVLIVNNYYAGAVDQTPAESPDIISVGVEYCSPGTPGDPLSITLCGGTQAPFNAEGSVSASPVGIFEAEVYWTKEGFGGCVGLGVPNLSVILPVTFEASGAICAGADGVRLQGKGGLNVAHATVSLDLIQLGKKIYEWIVHSPVDVLITDSVGRRVGIFPSSNRYVNEIPGATYSSPSGEPQVVRIPASAIVDGQYRVALTPVGNGRYTVTASVLNGVVREGQVVRDRESDSIVSGNVTSADGTIEVLYNIEEGTMTLANTFVRGDTNLDLSIDVSDAVKILLFLFRTGESLTCQDAGDANDDGVIDISDGIFVLNYLFLNGAELPPPTQGCGPDLTKDKLPECKYPSEECARG